MKVVCAWAELRRTQDYGSLPLPLLASLLADCQFLAVPAHQRQAGNTSSRVSKEEILQHALCINTDPWTFERCTKFVI